MEKKRNSSLELLRIISMILIIMHHYAIHGRYNMNLENFEIPKFVVQFFALGGKLGVNLFILITGYFMINSKFKLKKLIKLIGEVFFYSIVIFIIFWIAGIIPLNKANLLQTIFPISYQTYWFISIYIIIYILSPFINKLVNNLTKKEHFNIIAILIVIWSIIPTLNKGNLGFSELGWFILIYLIAAYIRKYPNKYFEKCKTNIIIAIISYIVLIGKVIFIDITHVIYDSVYFSAINMIPILIASVSLFLGFKNLKIKNSKIINGIAASTLGVYLIHDNPFVRNYIWINIFKNDMYNNYYSIIYAIISVAIVFIVCIIIDKIRIYTVEKIFMKIVDKIEAKINKEKLKNILDNIYKKFGIEQ